MAFLNSADSTSDCSQQKRRGEENSSEAFWVGQKPFVNVPLIRKFSLFAAFSKAEQPANVPHRQIKMCVLLSGTQCWKIWEFHCQIPTFHAGLGNYVSCFHILFSCVISTFPITCKSWCHTQAHQSIFKCSQMIQHETSYSFFPLAAREIHTCRHSNLFSLHSACKYHWGTTRQLLLGCHIENKKTN